ncbi:MAG: hypothetical protein N2449_08940 [Bacteroidales bacterium]|nr:hypothetical protein [Bacteroidales bacterium]
MKSIVKLLLIIIIMPFLMSNSCNKSDKKQQISNAVIDKNFDYSFNISSYQIKSATLKDSLLTVSIIANVCENDNIELVFNGNYLKSQPPKAQLGFRFIANEKCKNQQITRIFNVSKIKYMGNKTTILLLPGIEPITF